MSVPSMSAMGHERRTRSGRGGGACLLCPESGQTDGRLAKSAFCHKRALPPFAQRALRTIRRSRPYLWLDVGRPDHVGPLLNLLGNELAEVGGRAWKHSATKLGKGGLDFGIGQAGVDLPIELVDDFSGCALGRTNTRPSAGFVPRQEVAYHGN